MKTRPPTESEAADRVIEKAYHRHGRGAQIDIMNVSRIFQDARAVLKEGRSIETEMPSIIARYRKN